MVEIDWTEPECPISRYFTVKEAIYLPKWGRLANAGDSLDQEAKQGLVGLFKIMDEVRDILSIPIVVHVSFRPPIYNQLDGGAVHSAHLARMITLFNRDYFQAAVDWSADLDGDGHRSSRDCEGIRQLLLPRLESLGLRMENNGPDGDWIHLDTKPLAPGARRFFKP